MINEAFLNTNPAAKNLQVVDGYHSLYLNRSSGIDYSDGEVENFILKSLEELKDKQNSYDEWEKLISDWPTEYHFSWVRTNILEPVPFQKDHRVLELGGGTGILTHYISSRVKNIITIEGSLLRGKCISTRCSRFNNVNTIISNFEDLDMVGLFGEKSFDIITLIGVLEYTNKYYKQENGINALLSICNKLLKPGGILVIAIENRLGLKYLLGWEEDHVGIAYYGVENHYKPKDVITYGYQELATVLESSGFFTYKFLLPFPDYKLPNVILTPVTRTLTDTQYNLYNNLLYKSSFRNYSGKKSPSINAGRVVKTIIKNNLVADLSNSFIVITTPGKQTQTLPIPEETVAYYFSTHRRYSYSNSIRFYHTGPSDLYFEKLHRERRGNNSDTEQILEKQNRDGETGRVENGQLLDEIIQNAFIENDYNSFENYLQRWIDFISQELLNNKFYEFELMPFNIILNLKNELVAFDRSEWKCLYSFSLEQVVARFFILNRLYLNYFSGDELSELEQLNYILQKYNLSTLSEDQLQQIHDVHQFSCADIMLGYNPDDNYLPFKHKG